jgi:outer membrane protein assembly factor BamB
MDESDPRHPAIVWRVELPGVQAIAVGYGNVIVLLEEGVLTCLSVETGDLVWQSRQYPLHTSSGIALFSDGKEFRVFAPWNFDVCFQPLSSSNELAFIPSSGQYPMVSDSLTHLVAIEPDPSLAFEEAYDGPVAEIYVTDTQSGTELFTLECANTYGYFSSPWRVSLDECVFATSASAVLRVRF